MSQTRTLILIGLSVALVAGCATTDRDLTPAAVRFHIVGVSDVSLGGVDLSYVAAPGDLSAADLLRLGAGTRRHTLPLELTLHVAADNPKDNPSATLEQLAWTLQVGDRDVSSGTFSDPVELPAGVTTDVEVPVRVDLERVFSGGARDLLARALQLVGADGGPLRLRLLARPEVETAYGPVPYPGAIAITTEALP